VAGVSLFRISVRPNRLPRLCSGSGLTAWSGSCRQRSTGPRRLSSVSVFGQPIAKLDRSLRRCHGNGGDPLDMTITCLDATDFVYPPPVPARCLTLPPCSASHSQVRSTRRWGRNDEIDTVTRPTHRDSCPTPRRGQLCRDQPCVAASFAALSSCCTGCRAWICVLSSAIVMSSAFRSDCKLSICC
jgi:hypothetical protein